MGKRKSAGSTGHGGKEYRVSLLTALIRRKHLVLQKQDARRAKKINRERELNEQS